MIVIYVINFLLIISLFAVLYFWFQSKKRADGEKAEFINQLNYYKVKLKQSEEFEKLKGQSAQAKNTELERLVAEYENRVLVQTKEIQDKDNQLTVIRQKLNIQLANQESVAQEATDQLNSFRHEYQVKLEEREKKIDELQELNKKLDESKVALSKSLTDQESVAQEATDQLNSFRHEYQGIINIDEDIARKELKKERIIFDIGKLQESYAVKRSLYDKLKAQVAIFDEQIEFSELAIYKPSFDFNTSEAYKKRIIENKERQKLLIREGSAIKGGSDFIVNGSEAEGRKIINKVSKLSLRAFNNECDVLITKTTWKNAERMEERMRKAFSTINNFNSDKNLSLTYSYLDLKIEELNLVYERKLKIQEEREEQAEIRRREREEENLRKEAERVRMEEEKLASILQKVQEKAEKSAGEELLRLQAEIAEMGEELKAMQRKNDRVKTMAEQTRLGYIYIISNIGSFGENIYKIGMTRRLEPMDRVKELGDASVPFIFDTHAMIFSEDAPALEAELHKTFDDRRVNMINRRKEFFNVSLDEIKEAVFKIKPDVEFVDGVEAKDYFETLDIIRSRDDNVIEDDMPDMI